MGTQPFRVKQTSITTGVGTLTVIAPPSGLRSLNTHYGAGPVMVPYLIQGPSGQNPTYFEQGFGSFSNASSQLTRPAANVVLGSAGAGANVNLPSGTHDVFVWLPPWWAPVVTVTGTQNLALGSVGSLHEFTGASAADLDLPALANVPDGFSIPFRHAGTAIWSFDPNASETIEGSATSLAIYPGESGMLYRASATNWRVAFHNRGPLLLGTFTAAAAATLDIVAPFAYGFRNLLILLESVQPATDGVTLLARVSTDGGSSYLTTNTYTTYYVAGGSGASNVSGVASAAQTAFSLAVSLSNAANRKLSARCWLNLEASNFKMNAQCELIDSAGNTALFNGAHTNVATVNAMRFLMGSGNITATARVFAMREV